MKPRNECFMETRSSFRLSDDRLISIQITDYIITYYIILARTHRYYTRCRGLREWNFEFAISDE